MTPTGTGEFRIMSASCARILCTEAGILYHVPYVFKNSTYVSLQYFANFCG